MSVMSICASDDIFRRAEHAGNVVHGYSKLQEHRCASVPQNVGRDVRAKARKLSGGLPGSSLLRPDRPPVVFNNVSSGETSPAA